MGDSRKVLKCLVGAHSIHRSRYEARMIGDNGIDARAQLRHQLPYRVHRVGGNTHSLGMCTSHQGGADLTEVPDDPRSSILPLEYLWENPGISNWH